jgi:GNAT superfamily N-acetyltransferase
MEITIRSARSEDIPVLCGLLADLFALESDFEPDVVKQVKGLSMLLGDLSGSSLVLVAAADGSVIGMATVQTLISTAEGGRVGLVEDVIVAREFRGRGIGAMLLDRIDEWSRAHKLARLQLLADRENRPALDFYFSSNWTSTRLICMRKML